MNQLANLELLKEGDFIDTINAFLWSVSANFDGNIKDSELAIDKELPYVSLKLGNCLMECYDFQENLKTYIKTCIEGPGQLVELVKNFAELAEKAKGRHYKSHLPGLLFVLTLYFLQISHLPPRMQPKTQA